MFLWGEKDDCAFCFLLRHRRLIGSVFFCFCLFVFVVIVVVVVFVCFL